MEYSWSFSDKLAVSLACLAAVMALILFWVDKTPLTAGCTIAAMVLLVIFPVLHFLRSVTGRIFVLIILSVCIGIFGWKVWPTKVADSYMKPSPAAPVQPDQQPAPSLIINQQAKDSNCANVVAKEAKLDCEERESKKAHNETKKP
jgi:hypothetical protein